MIIGEQEERPEVREGNTQTEEIPDILLDEWAFQNQVESPRENLGHAGLGMYLIQEADSFIPNLEKSAEKQIGQQGNEVWELFFDGGRNKIGAGGGCMLISPRNERYFSTFHFCFSCSNNMAEYEALIHGLEWARRMGVSYLKVYGDSELVVNQVRNQNVTKNALLKSYKYRVWDLLEGFDAFNLVSIPRDQNKHVDRLAAIGAEFDIPKEISSKRTIQHVKVITRPLYLIKIHIGKFLKVTSK